MPGSGMASVSAVVQGQVAELLGLPAALWLWLALAGWGVALVLGLALALRPVRRIAAPPAERAAEGSERVDLDVPDILRAIAPGDDAIGGVLRWLALETEAEAVAYLELSPAAQETLRIEPRGLDDEMVARLASVSRRALVSPTVEDDLLEGVTAARWLGAGGTKVLLVAGASVTGPEPFRFARYLVEWIRSTRRSERPRADLEDRVRWIPGVAWAEIADTRARVLPSEGADVAAVRRQVDQAIRDPALAVEWLEPNEPSAVGDWIAAAETPRGEPAGPSSWERQSPERPSPVGAEPGAERRLVASAIGAQEPRIQLVEVALSENGQATADVRVTWKEQEIRGRGHGRPTRAGRHFAAAHAVADALRPLLDTDVVIEGLYEASTQDVDVLIAEVRLEGERFVGAVLDRTEQPDWTGARAVLDAVNRRLAQVAGRSGRV